MDVEWRAMARAVGAPEAATSGAAVTAEASDQDIEMEPEDNIQGIGTIERAKNANGLYTMETTEAGTLMFVTNWRYFFFCIVKPPVESPAGCDLHSQPDAEEGYEIVGAMCASCAKKTKWSYLSRLGQVIARQGLTYALQQHKQMLCPAPLTDPGRILCSECARWKEGETAKQYLARVEKTGGASVGGYMQIHVTGANLGFMHEHTYFTPLQFSENGADFPMDDILEDLATRVHDHYWRIPNSVQLERDGHIFRPPGVAASSSSSA